MHLLFDVLDNRSPAELAAIYQRCAARLNQIAR